MTARFDDVHPDALYHLATADEWAGYQETGQIEPASFAEEGFVHCSFGHQVPGTVERHFPGVEGLHAVQLDPDALTDLGLVEEDLYGTGQAYPHVYGAVPTAAVVKVTPL